jgi:hypothetical protein
MKYLIKIEEHIMDKVGDSSSHIISKISQINPNDLISGNLYEHSFIIKSGEYEGEAFKTIQKFLKKDNDNYIFRIVKIYSPNIAKKLDIQNKDLIKVKEENLINYHPLS